MQPHTAADLDFAQEVRQNLLAMPGLTRIPQCRRFTVLYSAGSAADTVFFLESGLVKIVKKGDENKEVLLSLIRPGEIFGEDALLSVGVRTTSAEVLQEASIVIVPKDIFRRFCAERSEVWRMLAEMLARREQELQQKIELLLLRDVEQRILIYLAELAEAVGVPAENGCLSVQFSQGEIASLVGATRETTSSILNSLARRELVELGRRKMLVSAPSRLREVANSPRVKGATP
ncbi:MAG: Crp/Fnr family transcriptional regulator [Acidobacteria bacterium]|nr:Crp/Fnr family transcriptional regulator [Acidobacteriota bacterium]